MKLTSEKSLWLVAAGVLAFVFAVSVLVRQAGLPGNKQLPQTWLTCVSMNFARNWCREGAVAMGFRLVELPRSVETPRLEDRRVYGSYPPGSIVPIWLAAKAAGSEPSIQMIVAINLGLHFLIALGLAGIVLNVLSGLGGLSRLAGAAGAGVFYVCAGGPFQFHWSAYFADMAVLLPVVLLVWAESFRVVDPVRHAWVRVVIPAVVFGGSLTDPLMVILAVVLAGWRLIVAAPEGRRKEFHRVLLELVLPVFLAVGLFFIQLATGGLLDDLSKKFLSRSFLDAGPKRAKEVMQVKRFFSHFRILDVLFLLIPCVAGVLLRTPERVRMWRTIRRQTALILVLFSACVVQLLVFWNHSYIHPFSVLKLYLPAALILGVAIAFLAENGRMRKRKLAAVGVLVLAMIPGVWRQEVKTVKAMPSYPFPALVDHIARTAGYRDVYLSPVIAIAEIPPQALSFTTKKVWGIKNIGHIEAVMAGIRDPSCILHFLVLDTSEIAALFSTVPCRKAVFGGITEYVVAGGDYAALAVQLDPLFKEQDRWWRNRTGMGLKANGKAYLVPWRP
jgi:hypothetical protein